MHLPFGPPTYTAPEEHAELPEIVPIQELSSRAIDDAAREMAAEPATEEEIEQWPTATA
jgi:hypothetical protein